MHEEKRVRGKKAENNPEMYQVEDPSSNRSHKYEKKDNT